MYTSDDSSTVPAVKFSCASLKSLSSPGSSKGSVPLFNCSTVSFLMSIPTTVCPVFARRSAVGSPMYPNPITLIFMVSPLVVFL